MYYIICVTALTDHLGSRPTPPPFLVHSRFASSDCYSCTHKTDYRRSGSDRILTWVVKQSVSGLFLVTLEQPTMADDSTSCVGFSGIASHICLHIVKLTQTIPVQMFVTGYHRKIGIRKTKSHKRYGLSSSPFLVDENLTMARLGGARLSGPIPSPFVTLFQVHSLLGFPLLGCRSSSTSTLDCS